MTAPKKRKTLPVCIDIRPTSRKEVYDAIDAYIDRWKPKTRPDPKTMSLLMNFEEPLLFVRSLIADDTQDLEDKRIADPKARDLSSLKKAIRAQQTLETALRKEGFTA